MCGLGKIQKANFYADKKSENSVPIFLQPIQEGVCSLVWSARSQSMRTGMRTMYGSLRCMHLILAFDVSNRSVHYQAGKLSQCHEN